MFIWFSPWNLKLQQPQLPRSEPDEQPNESSHLASFLWTDPSLLRRADVRIFQVGALDKALRGVNADKGPLQVRP
jgi:hypothetical protein